jgi:hypothetical protein
MMRPSLVTWELVMDSTDIDTLARGLIEEYGARAAIIAAQRARMANADPKQARLWRRIEVVLIEIHAVQES